MGQVLQHSTPLYVQACCSCGIEFAVPNVFDSERRLDHQAFYCPSGHSQSYQGQTALEREVAELKQRLASETANRESAQRQREWAEKRAKGSNIAAGMAKAAKQRLEHRVICGTCPHCQRTFKQLAAHMKSKHADKARGKA